MEIKGVCYVTFRIDKDSEVRKFAVRCKDYDQARNVAVKAYRMIARYVRISKKPKKHDANVLMASIFLTDGI